jgi:transcriptional regulator with XRE-family HTH domain
MTSTSLGMKVRAERQARNWTLAKLATASNISVSYLNDIEHDRRVPSLARLQQVAEALGNDVHGLIAGTDPYGLSAKQ